MKKWIGSAIVYLLLVIGGYSAYVFFAGDEMNSTHEGHQEESQEHGEHEEDTHEHEDEEDAHDGHGKDHEHKESEVTAAVELEGEALTIKLTDASGEPMDDLKVNHEKLMHLIVISEDLEKFQHLHPEKIEPGVFEAKATLEDGMYQAFVDITPAELSYVTEPLPVMVGEHGEHEEKGAHLHPESSWTKEQNGFKVTLNAENFSVKDSVVLEFDIEGGEPETYLGALGHVVVVDESLKQFIHVHPREGEEPVFEAHFTEPGMYKLWAEFKLDGEVYAFPYVLEITE